MKRLIALCLSLFLPLNLSGDSSSILIMGDSVGGAAAAASAPSYVESGSANSTGATSVVLTIASGNAIFVCARIGSNVTSTVSDNQGNTYIELYDAAFDAANNHLVVAYTNGAPAASHTVTVTPDSGSPSNRMIVHEISNMKTTSPVDDSDSGSGTGTAPTTPSMTQTETNALIVACSAVTTSVDFTAGGSFTERQEVVQKISSEDRTTSASGSYVADYTISISDEWGIYGVIFKGQS